VSNFAPLNGYPYGLKDPFPSTAANEASEALEKTVNASDGSAHAPTAAIEWSGASGGGFEFSDAFGLSGDVDVSAGLTLDAASSGVVTIGKFVAVDVRGPVTLKATPIAHKGIVYGAKAEVMTLLDLLLKPEILKNAWEYYRSEQTKDIKYTPLIGEKDIPAIYLNQKIMGEFAPKLKPLYYNPAKYKTYLDQLGIQYPTVRQDQKEAIQKLDANKKP
jgi:hypothetical protein